MTVVTILVTAALVTTWIRYEVPVSGVPEDPPAPRANVPAAPSADAAVAPEVAAARSSAVVETESELTGRCVTDDGHGVAAAFVELVVGGDGVGGASRVSGQGNADGVWVVRVPRLPVGPIVITADAVGYCAAITRVDAALGKEGADGVMRVDLGDVVMTRGTMLVGRVPANVPERVKVTRVGAELGDVPLHWDGSTGFRSQGRIAAGRYRIVWPSQVQGRLVPEYFEVPRVDVYHLDLGFVPSGGEANVISGRVVDVAGAAVAKVVVDAGVGQAVSDADGRFVLGLRSPEAISVALCVRRSADSQMRFPFQCWFGGRRYVAGETDVVIVLRPAWRLMLSARVRDTGVPVDAFRYRVFADESASQTGLIEALPGADGAVVVEGVQAGANRIMILPKADDLAPTFVSVDVRTDGQLVEVPVPQRQALWVEVVDDAGRPISGASVMLVTDNLGRGGEDRWLLSQPVTVEEQFRLGDAVPVLADRGVSAGDGRLRLGAGRVDGGWLLVRHDSGPMVARQLGAAEGRSTASPVRVELPACGGLSVQLQGPGMDEWGTGNVGIRLRPVGADVAAGYRLPEFADVEVPVAGVVQFPVVPVGDWAVDLMLKRVGGWVVLTEGVAVAHVAAGATARQVYTVGSTAGTLSIELSGDGAGKVDAGRLVGNGELALVVPRFAFEDRRVTVRAPSGEYELRLQCGNGTTLCVGLVTVTSGTANDAASIQLEGWRELRLVDAVTSQPMADGMAEVVAAGAGFRQVTSFVGSDGAVFIPCAQGTQIDVTWRGRGPDIRNSQSASVARGSAQVVSEGATAVVMQ